MNKFPKAFFGLSFKTENSEIKIKDKMPKSGKPSSKSEEKPKADFCKIKTNNKKIAEDFIFENNNFKEAKITHTFLIEKIEIPEELRNSKDFAKIKKNLSELEK
jgi:hypothetical protein